ncbi:MAG: hypothetical protein ACFCVK_24380 [Acidimicrobiales bacterium]
MEQPTEAARRALVEAIHGTDLRLVLAVAGGGNAAITDLLDVPGASRTVLEVRVPYARSALDELVGPYAPPAGPDDTPASGGAVSLPMAEAMALACRHRALALTDDEPPRAGKAERLLGVACTAALVTDRHKRGDHRAHIAIAGPDGVAHRRVELAKGELDRRGEDRVVADALLAEIAAAMGLVR